MKFNEMEAWIDKRFKINFGNFDDKPGSGAPLAVCNHATGISILDWATKSNFD